MFQNGKERLIRRSDLVFDFDGGADVHGRKIRDENFAASVTFGGSIPPGVHHVHFVRRNFLFLTGFGRHDGTNQLHFFTSRIKAELEFRFVLLPAVSQNLFDEAAFESFGMGILDFEFFTALKDFVFDSTAESAEGSLLPSAFATIAPEIASTGALRSS